MMTQRKHIKLTSHNKDTRWDRIRKKHCSTFPSNLKSDAVKKFIEIDYIGRYRQVMLNKDINLATNLDPVLVMNLRHEMFKEIPHKLPLATVAYNKNLQQCRDHNVAVENRYIENQLNQFRKHLQKQHEKNKVPMKKLHSLLIDNTDLMNSLESTHKHIEDFYKTPIDALQEVHELFTGQLEKHVNFIDENVSEQDSTDFKNEYLQNHLENFKGKAINLVEQENEQKEVPCTLNTQDDKLLRAEAEANNFDFMAKQNNEFNSNNKALDFQLQSEKNAEITHSPLENSHEVLHPLRKVIENQTVRCVRFDNDINVCHLKREESMCSNTSDGIDSVISDIAEEALKELQMEDLKLVEISEENGLNNNNSKESLFLNGCSLLTSGEYKSPLKEHVEIIPISEDHSNREQSKIIKHLFESDVHNKISILRKYFLKWVHYTTLEKIKMENVDVGANRVKKINIFMNKIRIEKNRGINCQKMANDSDHKKNGQKTNSMESMKVNKKYQNRIKVQQDIIDLQRLKLERQERIIMELKLHKLSEEAKEARLELKSELKTVIRSGDPKSKAKAKCLQIIGNLKDEEDDDLNNLRGKSLLLPKFLQNMQERALERNIRHEQVKQRRLQQEAEREAQKLALEEAKRLEDEETKRLRMEALKEKRRQEKFAKIIIERERQKYIENQRKAQDFYKHVLLKRIGMEGFKRLLQLKRDNLRKCEELRGSLYKKTYFQAWLSLYHINQAIRNQKADELHEKILKRKYFQIWLQYVYKERCKYNVAVDYYDFKLTEFMFRKWWAYEKRMQMIEEIKRKQAMSHHEWHLKWKVLDCWQRLPQILQLEKETEERRQRWRLKIWELLPDYTPNRDDCN